MITQDDLLDNTPLIENVLSHAKEDGTRNSIFLANGIKLESILIDYDKKNILISNKYGGITLVYLHAVSSFSQGTDLAGKINFSRETECLETDFFLQCQKNSEVNVYLLNGIRLAGYVTAFDDSAILLTKDLNNPLSNQVVMKTAIASISEG
jgi:RNA chaperone Hfq